MLRQDFPNVPITALTATARQQCILDIVETLSIKGCQMLLGTHNRPNLYYEVLSHAPGEEQRFQETVEFIKSKHSGHTGIIYFRAREKTERYAERFRDQHISALCYHAGLAADVKSKALSEWMSGRAKVMCATVGPL